MTALCVQSAASSASRAPPTDPDRVPKSNSSHDAFSVGPYSCCWTDTRPAVAAVLTAVAFKWAVSVGKYCPRAAPYVAAAARASAHAAAVAVFLRSARSTMSASVSAWIRWARSAGEGGGRAPRVRWVGGGSRGGGRAQRRGGGVAPAPGAPRGGV